LAEERETEQRRPDDEVRRVADRRHEEQQRGEMEDRRPAGGG
jgi:hypothetical protein